MPLFPLAASDDPPLYLLLPLASSLLYVCGALSLKRASQEKVDAWKTTFVSNVVTALLFAPLPLLPIYTMPEGGPFPWWQPTLIALAFVGGQACTMYSLNRGDVSVATPVIGTKVIFVAFFATLILGEELRLAVWLSAAMSAAGIALLNRGRPAGHRHVGRTVASALTAAACYAIFDVMVRMWAPVWGAGRLLPLVFGIGAVMSLVLVPMFDRPLLKAPRSARRPLLIGSAFIGLQSIILVTTIAKFEGVTTINIVYNARGLWSVLAVWLVGHWWGNREMAGGGAVFAWRMAGTALMLAAIVLAVSE